MSFLPPALVESTNRFVRLSPADQLPKFRHNVPGTVHFGGSVLRYSTTTPQKGA
jgi:hypothetical protein